MFVALPLALLLAIPSPTWVPVVPVVAVVVLWMVLLWVVVSEPPLLAPQALQFCRSQTAQGGQPVEVAYRVEQAQVQPVASAWVVL